MFGRVRRDIPIGEHSFQALLVSSSPRVSPFVRLFLIPWTSRNSNEFGNTRNRGPRILGTIHCNNKNMCGDPPYKQKRLSQRYNHMFFRNVDTRISPSPICLILVQGASFYRTNNYRKAFAMKDSYIFTEKQETRDHLQYVPHLKFGTRLRSRWIDLYTSTSHS